MLLLALLAAPEAHGQVPDTTRTVPADTVAADTAAADTLAGARADTSRTPPRRLQPALSYAAAEFGTPLHEVPPILQPALDTPTLLNDWPGSFVYEFGTVGWPDGWSPEGLNPQRSTLALGGIPFDDPVTGRPRYDLLPLEWLEPLRVAPSRYGAPYAVLAQPRPYPAPEPLTLMRYRTRGNGLQSVMALHVQQRRLTLLDTSGIVQIAGGYGGHANDGVYRGSRLTRMRQLYGRLRYAHPRWSVELSELHNRRHIGAHEGVQPTGTYESIYHPSTATVLNEDAERQTIRNDLSLTVRLRLLDGRDAPLTATTYWTAQTFRYLPGTDTLGTRTDRNGLRAYQDVTLRGHHLRLRLDAQRDRLTPAADLVASASSHSTSRLHLTALDSTRLLGFDVAAEGALHAADDLPLATGRLDLSRGSNHRLHASLVFAGQPVPWAARHGFGDTVLPVDSRPQGQVLRARLGASTRAGAFGFRLVAFAHRLTDALDYVRPEIGATGTIQVVVLDGPVTRVGATLGVDVRRDAERGFYGFAEVTGYGLLDAERVADPPEDVDDLQLTSRLASSLPEATARGRLGARYALFRGDLDLDLYLAGRAWSPFRSRVFHAPTGLFALPPVGARTFGPSGVLDVFVEAGIRAATLFISYENVLAGRVYAGTLLVPDYPLPGRRLRFGVYWPISG